MQRFSLANAISETVLSHKEKQTILNLLVHLPDCSSICHGDYHNDNVIFHNGLAVVLDWMTANCGNPAADVARTYMLMTYASLPEEMSIAEKDILQQIRTIFADEYLHSYIEFANILKEDILKWEIPVMAARLNESIPETEKAFFLREIRIRISCSM
ncbi:phosphotransferase [Bacillus sp. CRN 9]|nr:phosphotransferase [Bacillus sp. CRN 9]